MSGLHEYLRLKKGVVIANRARAAAENPVSRFNAVTSAEGRSGIRRTRIRGHQVITDSGTGNLGYDLGPSAPELILAALGSCLVHNFLINAALRDVLVESVTADVSASYDFRGLDRAATGFPRHPFDISYRLDVVSEEPEARIREVLEAVEWECPLYNLFTTPVAVTGALNLSRPQTAAEASEEAAS